MSGRFSGKWPTDEAGNPITVKVAAYPYNGEPHKLALTRAGKNPNQKSKAEKPLSPLSDESEIGAPRKKKGRRA